MGKIVLVTGGARSGKSRFAEKYAAKYGQNVAYIATAEIQDEEMRYRVSLHRSRRPSAWQTYEAPLDAHIALKEAGRQHDFILFDCLTLYMSNLLCTMEKLEDTGAVYALLQDKIQLLLQCAKQNSGTALFVTNEVGDSIVPQNALSRLYRDMAGLANQWMAEAADEVYLVTCGIPVNIKKLSQAWRE